MTRSTECRSCQASSRPSARSAAGRVSPWGLSPFLGSADVTDLRTRLGRASPLIGVLIIVMVLAVLCVGSYLGDRYAHRRAEDRVATALQPQLGTSERPEVDIEGFPFVTQIITGSVGKIHVVAEE